MPPTAGTSSAVLLVRVWLEDGELVRARIMENLDLVDRRAEIVLVAGTAAEVEHRVHEWLDRVVAPVTQP